MTFRTQKRKWLGSQGGLDPVEDGKGALRMFRSRGSRAFGVPEDHREFIAAVAGDDVLLPTMLAEKLPGDADDLIACVVAKTIVVVLEIVEIEEQEGHGEVLGLGAGEDGCQFLTEEPSIGQSAAFIGDRKLPPLTMLNGALVKELKDNLNIPFSGYTTSVDWAASAIAEFTYLDMILSKGLSPADAAGQLVRMLSFAGDKGFEGAAYRPAGFRIVVP